MIDGMIIDPNGSNNEQCKTCIQAKMHVKSFPQQSDTTYENIGDMTYCDVWGPARTKGPKGERYIATFTDGSRHHVTIAFLKKKSETEEKIKNYKEFIKTQHNINCKAYRVDNGGEFITFNLKDWAKANGIKMEYTALYSLSQHGKAK